MSLANGNFIDNNVTATFPLFYLLKSCWLTSPPPANPTNHPIIHKFYSECLPRLPVAPPLALTSIPASSTSTLSF